MTGGTSQGHRDGRRWPWVAAGLALVAVAGVAVVVDAPAWVQASAFAAAAAAAAFALPRPNRHPEVTSTRTPLGRSLEDRVGTALNAHPLARRAALGVLGLGVLAGSGLLRWLGPQPAPGTIWEAGRRLVTNDGDPLRPEDVPTGGVVTVWPDGAIDAELTAVMLIRLRQPPVPPTRGEHVVDRTLVAYSRICTHAGCPVALYRDRDHALFCPCHQATFDAAAGARPVFGPASEPLPQLPLGVDEAGYLVATGDFAVRPGPPGGGP